VSSVRRLRNYSRVAAVDDLHMLFWDKVRTGEILDAIQTRVTLNFRVGSELQSVIHMQCPILSNTRGQNDKPNVRPKSEYKFPRSILIVIYSCSRLSPAATRGANAFPESQVHPAVSVDRLGERYERCAPSSFPIARNPTQMSSFKKGCGSEAATSLGVDSS
jgi:hypothetical protein